MTRIAGTAAILCALLLLSAFATLAIRGFRPVSGGGVISGLENNWLIVLFKLHVGFEGVKTEALRSQNAIDYILMSLTSITCIGLCLTVRQTSRAWSIVGAALPLAGIVLFALTRLTGRSALMAAVIAFSLIMIWSHGSWILPICFGLAAGLLLLVGDFTESLHSKGIGVLVLIGYLSLIAWFSLVGIRMRAFRATGRGRAETHTLASVRCPNINRREVPPPTD